MFFKSKVPLLFSEKGLLFLEKSLWLTSELVVAGADLHARVLEPDCSLRICWNVYAHGMAFARFLPRDFDWSMDGIVAGLHPIEFRIK